MNRTILIFSEMFAAVLFSGCTGTQSTVTEYDAAGTIIKQTVSSESVIDTITKSTANKTVIMWEDGWTGYIAVSSGTTEDPTPHGKIFAGKVNKGAISVLPNQQNLPGIAKIIQATKSDIRLSLTDGVSATGSEAPSGGTARMQNTENFAESIGK